MINKTMNKKGDALQLFVFMIVSFILSICVVLFFFIGTTTYNQLIANSDAIQKAIGDEENATQIINSTFGKVPTTYQALKWISAVLIFGMLISILLSSYLVRTSPVWFIAYIFIWLIAIIVSVPMSNTYEQIYNTPVLAESFAGFYGQTYIFLYLPVWITIIGALSGIVMFVNMVRVSRYGGYA